MDIITESICILEFLIHALRALDRLEVRAYFRRRWFEMHSRHEWSETQYPRDQTRGKLKLVEKHFTAQHVEMDPRADKPFNWSFRPAGYSYQHNIAQAEAAARLEANAQNADEAAAIINAQAEAAFARAAGQKSRRENRNQCFGTKLGRPSYSTGASYRRGAM